MRTFDQGKALAQMTGLNSIVCGETVAPGQVESVSPFSAVPAIMPKSLILERYAVAALRALAASQSREFHHGSVLPKKRHAGVAAMGEAKRLGSAEIFAVRIRDLRVGLSCCLPPDVHAKGNAVWPSESGTSNVFDFGSFP